MFLPLVDYSALTFRDEAVSFETSASFHGLTVFSPFMS